MDYAAHKSQWLTRTPLTLSRGAGRVAYERRIGFNQQSGIGAVANEAGWVTFVRSEMAARCQRLPLGTPSQTIIMRGCSCSIAVALAAAVRVPAAAAQTGAPAARTGFSLTPYVGVLVPTKDLLA